MKSPLVVLLIATVLGGFWLASVMRLGLAQNFPMYKVSGYILDTNGRGIPGAEIIFNVPDIVPSVYSDSSGRYVIWAPAGTYHVNVWPPFDSNHVFYDQPTLVVSSDMTKNITLASGYKVSGYISDSWGRPVKSAIVLLSNFLAGWFSKETGYYFVTAPAGTYTLIAKPAYGPKDAPNFPAYYEYSFVVNGDLSKNITVGVSLFKISGYILDANGSGIAGANVIFNVPEIVPSAWSDASGHYTISAPAGTYHVNVWPPYDSNYISYDERELVVRSDLTKNVTLYSGYKVSGYVSTFSGTPVVGAAVILRNSNGWFGSGWFSNDAGYYFLSAPAGTYTIDAHPRTGDYYSGPATDFPAYTEYNFTFNRNTVKNITVGVPSVTGNKTSSPVRSPLPTPLVNEASTQKPISVKPSSSAVGSIINNNGTGQPPIQQTSNAEADPQAPDASCWTWIVIAAVTAVPVVSFGVLLKSSRKNQKT